jgi:hypothetical protein
MPWALGPRPSGAPRQISGAQARLERRRIHSRSSRPCEPACTGGSFAPPGVRGKPRFSALLSSANRACLLPFSSPREIFKCYSRQAQRRQQSQKPDRQHNTGLGRALQPLHSPHAGKVNAEGFGTQGTKGEPKNEIISQFAAKHSGRSRMGPPGS